MTKKTARIVNTNVASGILTKAEKPKVDRASIDKLIVISDIHAGCRLALCPPEGIDLDDGGRYMPSHEQLVLWAWWETFWNEWVPMVTKGQKFGVVFNGDLVDGVHHRSTTQISQNVEDQAEIAYRIMAPIADACQGNLWMIRGTEVHVGQSGCDEEAIAKRLGAKPNSKGQYARWEMYMDMNDQLIHFTHHIGTTGSSAHETSALCSELTAMFVQSARWGMKAPTLACRSHRHCSSEIRMPAGDKGFATCVVTPCWQLKTPYVYRVAGGRVSTPQVGGICIADCETGLYTRAFVRNIGRSGVVKL